MPRYLLNGLYSAVVLCFFLVMLRLVWSTDPTQTVFAQAQRLEAAGQISSALSHYRLISENHPESFYAARALLREGDLLAAEGRQNGDKKSFAAAVAAYARLATSYSSDPLSTEALLDAGKISVENLGDRAGAKNFYNQLLEKSGSKSDAAATATLKLGCLAILDKDGKTAQKLLQRVIVQWPNLSDRAAEARYNLGVTYETLFKNKEWATRAYEATIARYPNSTWANDASGRLGLIIYAVSNGHRPARRVLIDIQPLPDNGAADGSLWASLRPILASRGVEADEATLRGWSLAPFYAGFDPQNPSKVIGASFDAFENVLANAGLRFTIESGGTESEALLNLQDEIDAARPPLVYFEERGQPTWALCVGYDSDRGEVMLQRRGARFDTLNKKAFAGYWKAKSSLGGVYTLVSIVPTGAKSRPAPSLTPQPTPTAAPGTTPMATLMAQPEFVWELPRVSVRDSDQRALNRAATLLQRPREGSALLGAEGLNALAIELNSMAKTATPGATPQPQPTEAVVDATPLPEDATPAPESPYTPEATPVAPPAATREDGARAKTLLAFFGAPARSWAMSRQEAAAWCDAAANRLNRPNLKRAATLLRQSAAALQSAILLVPAVDGSALGAGDRNQIGEVARQVERARDAEREAAKLMR